MNQLHYNQFQNNYINTMKTVRFFEFNLIDVLDNRVQIRIETNDTENVYDTLKAISSLLDTPLLPSQLRKPFYSSGKIIPTTVPLLHHETICYDMLNYSCLCPFHSLINYNDNGQN